MSQTSARKGLGILVLALVLVKILPNCPFVTSANITNESNQPTPYTSIVDHSSALVWGPGLRPDQIVLPARYFHIHARYTDGTPVTVSLGRPYDISISCHGSGQTKQPCSTRLQQIDRGDGSVLVRYTLAKYCRAFAIYIAHSGHPVAGSPYRLPADRAVRSAECLCARPLDVWLRQNRCPTEHPQITADLRPFGTVNITQTREFLLQRFVGNAQMARSVALCHYVLQR